MSVKKPEVKRRPRNKPIAQTYRKARTCTVRFHTASARGGYRIMRK